jgi:hypothetical protein
MKLKKEGQNVQNATKMECILHWVGRRGNELKRCHG